MAPLLADLDLTGVVVTLDALHTQRAAGEHLVTAAGADYVMTMKANQPTLLRAVDTALAGPAENFVEHHDTNRRHGRTEQRIVRTAPVAPGDGTDFPHAAHVFRVIQYTGGLDGQRTTEEVAWCITSLTPDRAGPRQLGAYLRGHWSIENTVHYVRDVTFHEDASTVRTGTAPAAMATHPQPRHHRHPTPHQLGQHRRRPPPLRPRRTPHTRTAHPTAQTRQPGTLIRPWDQRGQRRDRVT